MEKKFIEIKAENADIALVTASLPMLPQADRAF